MVDMSKKNKEIIKGELEVMADGVELTQIGQPVDREYPDYEALPLVLQQKLIGTVPREKAEWERRVIVDRGDVMRMMTDYGASMHPITARTRVQTMLMKLEELGLMGNLLAAREFLDRTAGKVTQTIAVGHGRLEKMTDRELLEIVGVKNKQKI
jgi:hypothetical protein